MPVVTFAHKDLVALIGHEYSLQELAERMPMMGGDLDKVTDTHITIEWFPDRPDLLTLEGTGRALRAFLGHGGGLPRYDLKPSGTTLTVDASVQQVRPYAALCFVRGVPFDDEYVKTVMDAQEKLTLAPGRKRRKIAIGIHDAAGIQGPFTYSIDNDARFVPLGEREEMSVADILSKHPKGKEYAHLLQGDVPVFKDGSGNVLSMPPIINAQSTAVTANTSDILVDVTGTDEMSVKRTIALLATGFAERGGTIESIHIEDAAPWDAPTLPETEHILHEDDVQSWLGIPLSGQDIAAALQKMGHHAEHFDNKVLVRSPIWRFDLLHNVDWLEDIAIGYGFEHFEGAMPTSNTVGMPLPTAGLQRRLESTFTGMGWFQAQTLSLSDAKQQWQHWGAPESPTVHLRNPVLEEQTLLRVRMAPSLLHVLAQNRHRSLPQQIFEIGYVQIAGHNALQLGAVQLSAKASFNDAKAIAQAIVRDVMPALTLEAATIAGTISGRAGAFMKDGKQVGWFGELHPETIHAFQLGAPAIALELDLES